MPPEDGQEPPVNCLHRLVTLVPPPPPPLVHQERRREEDEERRGGWYIPRAALWRSGGTSASGSGGCSEQESTWQGSPPRHLSPPSSTTSTQSGGSGSLLLTAASLANLRLEAAAGELCSKDPDSASLASSTHFTIVNYPNTRKERRGSICSRHYVSAIVLSMSAFFLIGLLIACYLMHLRTYNVHYSK